MKAPHGFIIGISTLIKEALESHHEVTLHETVYEPGKSFCYQLLNLSAS